MRRIVPAFAFACLALSALVLPALAQTAPAPLPPGPGQEVVGNACSACHRIGVVTQLREGPDAWRHQVHDMVQRGAQVSPDEIDLVVTYLSSNFGPGNPLPSTSPVPVTLPDGPGKEVVQGNCGICHNIDRVAGTRRSAKEWHAIVLRMQYLGAPMTEDTAREVEAYLLKNVAQ